MSRVQAWAHDSGSRAGSYARGATPAPPSVGGSYSDSQSQHDPRYRPPPAAPSSFHQQHQPTYSPQPSSTPGFQGRHGGVNNGQNLRPSPPSTQRPFPSQHPRANSAYAAPPVQYAQQHGHSQGYSDTGNRPIHQSFSDLSLGASPPTLPHSHSASSLRAPTSNSVPGSRRTSAASFQGVVANAALSSSISGAAIGLDASPICNSSASALSIALPTQADLATQRETAANAQNPAASRVSWAKSVLKFVERSQASSAEVNGKITDPTLVKWTDESIRIIISSGDFVPPIPEALYLRGELSSSGKFPSYRSKDLALAFRDFEAAANLGYHPAWAKIALAYESFADQNGSSADKARAKKAYEEGMRLQEVTCVYRMGMAYLLGQLGIAQNAGRAIPLIRQAASLSTVDDPLPAYIFGMLLSGELDLGAIVSSAITLPMLTDPRTGMPEEPRPWVERSAYLGYAPAQFKMGYNYEYASMGCGYDPLLSVQYYSLASQQGDIEADMALSKWFLCGSESFDLQEDLAFTFAEKAARKGLPSAEFALGYYFEIGIGGKQDIDQSKRWYRKAAAHDNEDAKSRLAAINATSSNTLSRDQHESQINDKIVRRRTQAKVDADRRKLANTPSPALPPMPTMPALDYNNRNPTRKPPNGGATRLETQEAFANSGGFAAPVRQDPPQMSEHRSEPDIGLRRRETMRQVEQAAGYGKRPGAAATGGHDNLSGTNGRHGSPAIGAHRRENNLSAPTSHTQRYSLVDSGPANGGDTPGVAIISPPAAGGAQTFEAMGLKTGRVKADQECIIA